MYFLVIMVHQLSDNMKKFYISTRFHVKDTWPPEQLKEFTPLNLLYRKHVFDIEHLIAISKALCTGAITDIISATCSDPLAIPSSLHHHDKLRDALEASKTTTDISEILDPLEVIDKPQTILIDGAPGMGKTIPLKHIAYSWAKQRVLQKYKLVFLIDLSDPPVQKMSSLKDLFRYFGKRKMKGDELAMYIKHITSNQGKTLTFLLDGYDELPKEVRDNSLIADILNRQVLPDCGLIVSSRPHASMLLRKQATLQVDILGFTEEQRKHYIKHSLYDQAQIKQLTTYLEQHDIISSPCYVPFNIVSLLFLYKQVVTLPNNATKFFDMFICLTICRHLAKHGIATKQSITHINDLPEPYRTFLQQLSKLCLHALNNNQLIFTLDQIKQWCPQVESILGALNAFGLLQAIEHVSTFQTTTTTIIYFLHLSVQEFLAANYITTLSPDEELCILNKHFWSDSHTNLFAIYLTRTKGQRPAFKTFLSGGDNKIAIHEKFLNDKLSCVRLYRCFNEVSDNFICSAIENKFSDGVIDFSLTILSPSDIENTAVLITCGSIKKWKKLRLDACYIQDAGLCTIHQMLSSSVTIEELGLPLNDLSPSSAGWLAEIVISCEVQVLDISGNKTLGQTKELFPTILSTLSMLNVADTGLTNKVAIMIFNCLKEKHTKLTWLDISDNEITDNSCEVIAETLQVNNVLQHLYLNANRISKEGAILIVNSLRLNDALVQLKISDKDSTSEITTLQDIINSERRCKGVSVQLNITIGT